MPGYVPADKDRRTRDGRARAKYFAHIDSLAEAAWRNGEDTWNLKVPGFYEWMDGERSRTMTDKLMAHIIATAKGVMDGTVKTINATDWTRDQTEEFLLGDDQIAESEEDALLIDYNSRGYAQLERAKQGAQDLDKCIDTTAMTDEEFLEHALATGTPVSVTGLSGEEARKKLLGRKNDE